MRFYKVPISIIIGPYGNIPKRIGVHIIMSVFISIGIMIFQGHSNFEWFYRIFCLSIVNDLIMSTGHIWIFYNLDQNFDWLKRTWARFSSGVFIHSVFSLVAFFLTQLILFQLLFQMSAEEVVFWFAEYWWLPVVITGLVIVFTTTVGFFQNWKKSLVEEEKIEAEMMAYKFESLKGQINPSFLFDSFDALKRLIDKDEQESVLVIQKMSRLYRMVLENKDMELISLKDELQLLKIYQDLLKLRFGNEMSFEIDFDVKTEERVVPMAVQGAIELLLSDQNDGEIKELILRKEKGNIMISLDGHIDLDEQKLENLNRRYEFFTDRRIQFTSKDRTAIQIPILTEES